MKTDFITWTGDNSAHNVWDNTAEEITEYTRNITNTLKESLGADSKIQVYPIQGNHDTWPVNVQEFTEAGTNYAINHFKQSWTDKNWLSEEEIKVFEQWGYYSKPFEFNTKGKVIGVNMQACNDLNWWLLDDRTDPGYQLEWLEDELSQIEKDGGFAHIIAHIPSRDCLHQFGYRYHALIERYQHIVRFQSFGHTHDEDFYITRSIEDPVPIGWSFVAGSGTSGDTRNPSFAVIEYDKEFMVPINIETYFMNLTEANSGKEPEWKVLHDFKNEYSLKDLSPSSMLDFTQRMYQDSDLASQYLWNKGRRGKARPEANVGEKQFECLNSSEIFELRDCQGSPDIHLKGGSSADWFNYLIANWILIE